MMEPIIIAQAVQTAFIYLIQHAWPSAPQELMQILWRTHAQVSALQQKNIKLKIF